MDVGDWLRKLGLEQYAAAFRDNAIDASVLPGLTAEDLKDLGVTLVGHRRRLLDAIAALGQEAVSTPSAAPMPAAAAEAERRQLTVLFCDLAGSTELAARLDPEDLRAIINAYHQAVAAVLTGFGGFVAKYMGDGVLAYFGYPQAHEEDCERAVRAGLAIVVAVARLDLSEHLAVRIGIATGLVVVGDLIGTGAAQEQAVVGETPNLAARLQALAEPNEIVIADSTRRQIGSLFEIRDLGPQALKGFAAEQLVWRVIGESGVASRFEALRSGETPLVGRDEEIDLLLRRWAQAKAGEGRVVLVSAEPGIGKSRLAEAVEERIAAEPHTRLRYFCSPHHQDSALYPVIGQLERAAGFSRDDSMPTKQQKLAALLGESPPDELSLLAELLSLPATQTRSELELTPQRRKEQTFEALLGGLDRFSRRQPVLMLFEDLHWMDPTSRELLDRTIARVESWPVLLVATFRPEFVAPWTGLPHVTMLALNRLGRRDGALLVEQLVGNAGLPADLIDEIVERTDGVPLFLEEVTKVVMETAGGSDAAARGTLAAIPGARLAVPATLQASLMARLDRLGPVPKEIAQIGAAIGREFSYELLSAVAPRGETETQAALARLVAAGLVFQRGAPPTAEYQFKHALVQDTAYGTLLRGPRQALHARIADAISERFSDIAERQPELLAHHLAEAGQPERAALSWRKAGEQAVRRAANREAIGHFRRALALVEAQPEGAARSRAELAILTQLAPPLMGVHGWSAPEVGEVVERAAATGRRLESSAELAPAIANLWIFNIGRGRIDRADEISADLFRMADELGDDDIRLQAHHCAWATRFFQGRIKEAAEHVAAGAALYDAERHAHHRHLYLGHDPRTCSMNFGASVSFAFGYPERAQRLAIDGIAFARELAHPPSLANSLWRACEVFAMCEDAEAVLATATELVELTDVHGLPQPRVHAFSYLGWALARSGGTAEGLARLQEGERQLTAMGAVVHATFVLGLRADGLLAAGDYAEGLEKIDRALAIAAEGGEHVYLALLHRIRAKLLVHARGASDPAVEASLKQALAIARQQEAKGFELGAAVTLARLWVEAGRRDEARDLLAPLYGWFTEGFDTPDLMEARALLDELR
jgi:class 3 adenylate cyclase/predicted ATPase